MKALGSDQKSVLTKLTSTSHGTWHRSVGWYWGNHSTTIRILESLVRRGLVEKFDHPRHPVAYRATELGKE